MRRWSATVIGMLTVFSPPAHGQTLRQRFIELFTFGDCGASLCLGGSSQLIGHGDHFIPAATASGQAALDFVTNAVATNVTNVPVPSTSTATVFKFVNGLPVRTDISAGPIFGERGQTLGRGRLLAGINTTYLKLNSVRGVPMDNLEFNFAHQDIPPTGLGNPDFENDLIQVRTNLDVKLFVTTAFVSYGLLDMLDVGVAVPFVFLDVSGRSTATILPIGSGANGPHQFEGTPADPVLVAVSSTNGTAAGIGDIAGRLKIRLHERNNVGIGVIGEIRLPTGNEDDLLGSGEITARGLAIVSARFGAFTPHLNAGYIYRKATFQNNAVLATIGFDQLLAPWATMAVDFATEWQVGGSAFRSQPIVYQSPVARTVPSTLIPNRRDDLLNGSIGFKLSPSETFRIVVNTVVPVGNGGVTPTASWTAGFELTF